MINREFYSVLFNKGEYTCFQNSAMHKVNSSSAIVNGQKANAEFFSINPIKKGKTRAGENTESIRNFLFEIDCVNDSEGNPLLDDEGKEIPVALDEQRRIIKEYELPWATAVYSGGKSIHYILALTESLEDESQYRAVWMAIWNALDKRSDKKTKDRARLSRAAGAVRMGATPQDHRMQSIEGIRKRISLQELETWLLSKGENWNDYMFTSNTDIVNGEVNLDASTEDAMWYITTYCLKGAGSYVKGNRDDYAYKLFIAAVQAGVQGSEALGWALSNLSTNTTGSDGDEAVIKSKHDTVYKNPSKYMSKVITVRTKKDIEDFKIQKRKEKISGFKEETTPNVSLDFDSIIDSITPPRKVSGLDWMADINNYVFVGDDYYAKQFNHPGNLINIKSTTLKNRYWFSDADLARIPNYQMFTVEPGHDKDFKQVLNDIHWNRYRQVSWNPKPGGVAKYPYIIKLLKHLFGKNKIDHDQLEEILDWLTVLIKYPKTKLHQILLYSTAQGTSKTAFAKLVSWLVEENYMKVSTTELEEKYNGNWADKLVIHIDEGKFKNPKDMAMKLRDLGTSDTINLRLMGTDYTSVPFYGKFIITTNESDGLYVEEGDRRIWAREAQVIPDADKDADYEDKMKLELPYFIHDLLNREMKYPVSQGEFYLPRDIVNTGGKMNVAFDNKSDLAQRAIEFVQTFLDYNKHLQSIICTPGEFIDKLNSQKGYEEQKISAKAMGKIIRNEFKTELPTSSTRAVSTFTNDDKVAKWYVIYRKNVLGLTPVDTKHDDIFYNVGA